MKRRGYLIDRNKKNKLNRKAWMRYKNKEKLNRKVKLQVKDRSYLRK